MKTWFNIKNMLVLGFALFAMFFGAGNLIFPPYLGLQSGSSWLWGFLSFMITDAGLAVLALVAVMRTEGGLRGITGKLGKTCSAALILINTLCLGPLVAIPRTAATTFELGVAPLLPGCSSWICSGVFFLIVALLCIRPARIVDIVGKVLAPVMFVAILALIVRGVIVMNNNIVTGIGTVPALKLGLRSGYQTLDMMAALLFSMIALNSMKQQGNLERRTQVKAAGLSGVIAALALFVVYGGLAYLGANAGGMASAGTDQAGLVIAITTGIMGRFGTTLLGVIVAIACLTTAIGLVSACAESCAELFNKRVKYEYLVVAMCVFSMVVSNIGLSAIISVAAPVLELVYPVLMIMVILSFFDRQIKNANVYRAAAIAALIVSVMSLAEEYLGISMGASLLPLYGVGLQWVLPAALGALIGALIPGRESAGAKQKILSAQKHYH